MPALVGRPTPEDRIRAALWFAEHGFGVFSVWSADDDGVCRCPKGPDCDNPGKHPIPRRGFLDATTEPERIRALLSAGSEPNYGLVCPDGVFALDVDGEGLARLEELEQTHGTLPETLSTTTANGRHIFLRWPADMPRPIGHLFGFVTRWGTGRDAGYVIGPRSVHASGAAYAPAGVAAIADLPDGWARAAVERPGATGGPLITVGYVLPETISASESRYEAIRGYTAHLYNRGLSIPEMWPLVRDMLAPRFAERLTERELRSRFDRCVADLPARLGPPRATAEAQSEPVDVSTFPLPEDRGGATLSDLGEVQYVDDLVRPGRIVVWAAEEGSGKSYAVAGELAIRLAAAGGVFAETWEIRATGPVLVLSEMHPDDDYHREEIVLGSLGLGRDALAGRYWRLDLMTAAGGRPALTVPEWRGWATNWMREQGVLMLVVDTVTGATQVDPWGREIQQVYTALRMMLADYRQLAVILVVHMRKTDGRADERPISDVLGEWGRWCDVVVLQENEGLSLEKTKITTRKRVDQQRRIVATKTGGLLVNVQQMLGAGQTKVEDDVVLAAIANEPGLTTTRLGELLGVGAGTASRYIARLGDRVRVEPGPRRSRLIYPSDSPNQAESLLHETLDATVSFGSDSGRRGRNTGAKKGPAGSDSGADATVVIHAGAPLKGGHTPAESQQSHNSAAQARHTEPEADAESLPVGSATGEWVAPCQDYERHRSSHRRTRAGWVCTACNPELAA